MTKQELQFTGRFDEGYKTILIEHHDKLKRLFHHLGDDLLEVTVKKFYKNRTNRQNRYIWGIIVPTVMGFMQDNEGESPSKDAVYAHLRVKVVGQEMVIEEVDGVSYPIVKGKRFSHMTTVEFAEAVDKIIAYYAEQGLDIPVPKEENLIENFL